MISNEDFITAVKNSISIADTLRKLNLVAKGGNYRTVHKRVKELGLDTSHWLGQRASLGTKRTDISSKPIEEILVENCEYSRKQLKIRLEKENILKKECYICGQKPEWNSKPLIFIMDHINGINNDNRIGNLRMTCPNCNSQLDTFCGRKNKGRTRRKDNFCINCGIKISSGCLRCVKCANIERRKIKRPHIDEVIKNVNEKGYKKYSKEIGISDNAIKKWIKKEGLLYLVKHSRLRKQP
jgi:hypothetical protein